MVRRCDTEPPSRAIVLGVAWTILKSRNLGGHAAEGGNKWEDQLKSVLILSCIIIAYVSMKHKESIFQNKKKSVPTSLT